MIVSPNYSMMVSPWLFGTGRRSLGVGAGGTRQETQDTCKHEDGRQDGRKGMGGAMLYAMLVARLSR